MSKENPLVEKYGSAPVWVNWKLLERNGRPTKIPYCPLNKQMASSTDPKTWGTHAQAKERSENIGIVFSSDKLLLGIDLDHCVDINSSKIVHKDKGKILLLMSQANTYTELSPSYTGLHLYLALTEPLILTANRHEGYEAYTEGRYFTSTGIPFGVRKEIRTVTPSQARELLELIGYPWGKDSIPEKKKPASSEDTWFADPDHRVDTEALEQMFAASNGDEIKALYNGDISEYKNDASRADMAFLAHLAFWTGKSASKMEAIWLASPLGGRDKTQKRADYRIRSIGAAISNCTKTYNPVIRGTSKVKIGDPSLNLLYTMKESVKSFYKNTENISRIIANHPDFADTFRFDEYRNIIDRKVNNKWRNMEDWDAVDVQTKISVLFSTFAGVGKEMVYDAIVKVAYDHTVDTAAMYLRSLIWDQTPRLDSWIAKAYHTPDDEYHQKIGANWLKGLVKRIIEPGCKFDYVLVLEGEQGIKKSTSLLVLAGELGHVETTMSTDTKDFFMQFLGNAVVEFSEGETLSRTEVKRMKAIITVQIDKFRAPYGKAVVPHPRRCVFAMTTNQSEYLKDETGNRRWLPVAVRGVADISWIEDNREQLLAEAYHRVITGKETTWEFPEEEMIRQQNMRRIQDSNADTVVNWYLKLSKSKRDDGITVEQVYREGINGGFGGALPRPVEMGIADSLKTVLMLEKRRGMIGGLRTTRWYPTDKTFEVLPFPAELLKEEQF